MQKTFQVWLFLCVATAFVLTFGVSFYRQTSQARINARKLIQLKIADAKEQIRGLEENQTQLLQMRKRQTLAKARAVALLIEQRPEILTDRTTMERIRKALDVDELHVSDEHGILIYSHPQSYEGYDMNSQTQSRPFMKAIQYKDFEYLQEVQAKGINGQAFQYAGVARQDKPGIVQIGYVPERYNATMKITDIRNLAKGFRIGDEGRLLVMQNGRVVSVEDDSWLGKTASEIGFDELDRGRPAGMFGVYVNGVHKLCSYEMFGEYILAGTLPDNEVYLSRDSMAAGLIVFYLVLFAVVFVLVSFLVQKIVVSGIHTIIASLHKITAGNLNEEVAVRTNEEFTDLSNGINQTVGALKDAIAETASRIDRELELARAIQIATLPNVFPPFPDRMEFDIYASMDTAKQVGGDFYDFFFIDSNHLAVVMADVSGKGIPAAMFMMTAKTHIKNLTKTGLSPAEVLEGANNYLCENNDTGMFVTVFFGILEIMIGRFTYVNAGHLPPLWRHADENGYQRLHSSQISFVLGAIENMPYTQDEIFFAKGDRLFLYTDGVTEAVNPQKELYGEAQLQQVMNGLVSQDLTLPQILDVLRKDILRHAAGAEQSDDITMLMLQYNTGVNARYV